TQHSSLTYLLALSTTPSFVTPLPPTATPTLSLHDALPISHINIFANHVDHPTRQLTGDHNLPGVDLNGLVINLICTFLVIDLGIILGNAGGIGVFMPLLQLVSAGLVVGVKRGDGCAGGPLIDKD